ncbi:hypothetical protein [Sutcliffiella deserti]|uniref:hypothetical protein n=1 Tax=Sutcliffiella deserti TaxID=2875501 RepID=UPI001CC10EC2|nr:hypothetical protein [Sutcliffiella deserti]
MRRRNRIHPVIVLSLGIGVIVLFVYLLSTILISAEGKAERLVEDFYAYEQEGDYGRSWELMHSSMQERFQRGSYIQDRAHVFNNHFGAETFTYNVSDAEKLKSWKMVKDGETFDLAYKFKVEQTYKGKYGHFLFVQYVYVVKEEKDWRIVWDYNK